MKRAALYCRVSTISQSEGTSLESQLNDCRGYAHAMGYQVVAEYSDVISGSTMSRIGMESLLQSAAQHLMDVVICFSVDRASRDLSDLLLLDQSLERNGVSLEFVKDKRDPTPSGDLFFAVKGAFGQYERSVILERVRRGKDATAARGVIMNTSFVAYGYTYNQERRTLDIDEATAPTVRLIFDLYARQGLSRYEIAHTLNERSVPTPRGGRYWHTSTLGSILANEIYAGRFAWNKNRTRKDAEGHKHSIARPPEEWLYTDVPALVSEEVWQRAQSARADNALHSTRNRKRDYLLNGILFCGSCGRRMTGRPGRGQSRYYYCPSETGARSAGDPSLRCSQKAVRGDLLDAFVWETIAGVLADPGRIEGSIRKRGRRVSGPSEPQTAQLERSLAALRTKQARLLDAYLNGTTIDQPTYERRALAIKKEIGRIERETAAKEASAGNEARKQARLKEMLEQLAGVGESLKHVGFEHRRSFVLWYELRVRLSSDARAISIDGLPLSLETIALPEWVLHPPNGRRKKCAD